MAGSIKNKCHTKRTMKQGVMRDSDTCFLANMLLI